MGLNLLGLGKDYLNVIPTAFPYSSCRPSGYTYTDTLTNSNHPFKSYQKLNGDYYGRLDDAGENMWTLKMVFITEKSNLIKVQGIWFKNYWGSFYPYFIFCSLSNSQTKFVTWEWWFDCRTATQSTQVVFRISKTKSVNDLPAYKYTFSTHEAW